MERPIHRVRGCRRPQEPPPPIVHAAPQSWGDPPPPTAAAALRTRRGGAARRRAHPPHANPPSHWPLPAVRRFLSPRRGLPRQPPTRPSPPPAPTCLAPGPRPLLRALPLNPRSTHFPLPLARGSCNHWSVVPVHFLREFSTSWQEEAAAPLDARPRRDGWILEALAAHGQEEQAVLPMTCPREVSASLILRRSVDIVRRSLSPRRGRRGRRASSLKSRILKKKVSYESGALCWTACAQGAESQQTS
ncbi:serine/threonine-protein kinase LMTK3-like [Lutra lutra]|uniref:serine/threonine-protein kinase LMTK3-like n=1 Tax=Lutra lutra TaxID=9657 RepID=UPI001FD57720|nr:serine/threonine-protein kinase LMTK3-like [Lutra lutra]